MALYHRNGSFVGGFPAFLGIIVFVVIFFGGLSCGINAFVVFILGFGAAIGLITLFNHTPTTPSNYYEDILGKWICDTECRNRLENEPIYFLEFKKDGILIWHNGSKAESYHYKIKGKYVYIEGIRRFKISELWSKAGLWLVECRSKKLIMFNRYL